MALGKQAKIISDKQVRAILAELDTRRYLLRDRAMFLFSLKAGLRAKEIASVTWGMVTDAEGQITRCDCLREPSRKGEIRAGDSDAPRPPGGADSTSSGPRREGAPRSACNLQRA
jgi:hypothetical protein